MKPHIVISLGSNLDNREQFLQQAIALLSQKHRILCASSLYETSPTDFFDQDSFLNAVAIFSLQGTVDDFFADSRAIEKKLGNDEKKIDKGPRKIDLDIVLCEEKCVDATIKNHHLTVPHKSYHQRLFVLRPLRECEKILKKEFTHPLLQQNTVELLREGRKKRIFSGQKIKIFKKKWLFEF